MKTDKSARAGAARGHAQARPAGQDPGAPEQAELSDALQSLRPVMDRAACYGLIAGLLVLVPTAYMMEVYGRALDSRNPLTLLMLTLLVLGAYAVMELLELACAGLLRGAGMALERLMQRRVFNASFEACLRHLPGGGAHALSDLARLREFLYSPLMLALIASPLMVLFALLLLAISPWLGLFALGGALLQGLLTWRTDKRTREPLMQAQARERSAQTLAEEGLRQADTLQALGMWPALQRRWQQQRLLGAQLQLRAQDAGASLNAWGRLVQQLWFSALLGLAAWLLLRDALPGGAAMLIVCSVLGARMLTPLLQIIMQWRALALARQSWVRLTRLLAQFPPQAQAMPLPAARGEVQVEGLSVAPPGHKDAVLRHISFSLAAGEALAIVGPSSAGKSSLARALVGLWRPLRGAVRLDGMDVSAWRRDELGPQLGYLPQEVELLDGSIGENIARFGRPSPEELEAAGRAVGLHEWIASLPLGYDTPVGADGSALSGGQKQRIALARAFYGSPAWVVLDEPNAALDAAGEQALLETLGRFKAQGSTIAVVTHRSGVLAACDKVLVLRDGAVLAFGPREEVIKPARPPAALSQTAGAAA